MQNLLQHLTVIFHMLFQWLVLRLPRRVCGTVLAALAFSLFPQSASRAGVVWKDTFENPATDGVWFAENGVWQEGAITETYSGPNGAATVIGGNYPETADSRFIRFTSFVVPAVEDNPRLRFWHWYSFSTSDQGFVEVQVAGSGIWERVSPDYVNTSSGVYSAPLIDLSAYAGKRIQIAFHFIAVDANPFGWDNSSGWYIDDVSLETGPLQFNNPEGFESGLGDWYVDYGTWEVGPVNETHSGTNGAATVLNDNYAETVDSRLVSPPFLVSPTLDNPRLRFWHWYSFSTSDRGFVEVQVAGSGIWERVSPDYVNTSSGVYSAPLIDLSAYAGKRIQIAFHFIAVDANPFGWDNSSGWYIDDVSLETGPLQFNNPEGFESGLGDWYVDYGTWEVGAPTSGPGVAHSGVNSAGTSLGDNYAETVDSRLVSPWFVVPECGSPLLRYWHWHSFSTSDTGSVEIQESGQTEWTVISPQYTGTSGGWTFPLIDLRNYRGKTARIAFHFIAVDANPFGWDNSSGWYVDDIQLPQFSGIEIGRVIERTNVATSVPITAYSSPGITNLQFVVRIPTGTLEDFEVDIDSARFASVAITPLGAEEWQVTLGTTESAPLNGFERIGKLSFTGIVPQSAFVELAARDLVATRLDGTQVTCVGTSVGRAVLIAREPLLEGWLAPSGERGVTLFGKADTNYIIHESTDIGMPLGTWSPALTNTVPASLFINLPLQGTSTNETVIFLNAKEQ